MLKYRLEDLKIIDDPISLIRKDPSMYAGHGPWGPGFAADLVRDLVFLDALPAQVENYGDWWVVSSAKDWLVCSSGRLSFEPFFRIVPIPEAGHACFRTEILLTAFADCVITFGSEGPTWVVGEEHRDALPTQLSSHPSIADSRRSVAYLLNDTG